MAIFRNHKTKGYTVMSNHHLCEKSLSLKSKGLLSIMLSLPDEWEYSIIGLAALSKDGKDSVMSALDELCEFRYVDMTTMRNNKGQYETVYDIYETPNQDRCGKSESENPIQYNTNNESNSPINSPITTPLSPTRGKQKVEFDLSFIDAAFGNIMIEWMTHRKDIKKPFRSLNSIKKSYNDLIEYSNGDPVIAQKVVDQSIANGYQGLFPLKQGVTTMSKLQQQEQESYEKQKRVLEMMAESERRKQDADYGVARGIADLFG